MTRATTNTGGNRLELAVRRWVEVVLEHSGQRTILPLPDQPILAAVSPDEEESLLTIGQHLPNSAPFLGVADLLQFLGDTFAEICATSAHSDLTVNSIVSALLARLQDPLRLFTFQVPLALRSELSVMVNLPERGLRIETEKGDAGRILLRGSVTAPTEPGAITRIERQIESILGVSLALDLCAMLLMLPGTSPQIAVEISPHNEAIPSLLTAEPARGVAGAVFQRPASASEIERKLIEAGNPSRGLERYGRNLTGILEATDERATELRNAASLLLRASVTSDVGLVVTYSFMCLEAILLDPATTDNILGRLSEAVAYRIGKTAQHRSQLRKDVKELYNFRSRYVHTGRLAWSGSLGASARKVS